MSNDKIKEALELADEVLREQQDQEKQDTSKAVEKFKGKMSDMPGMENIMSRITTADELQNTLKAIITASQEKLEDAEIKKALKGLLKAVG